MITNREKLIETYISAIPNQLMAPLSKPVLEHFFKWLSEQDFALVPLSPTQGMLKGAADSQDRGSTDLDIVIYRALEAGNILKEQAP